MRINQINQSNNYQPNFNSINIIQINKKAFGTQTNLERAQSGVTEFFRLITDEKPNAFEKILGKVGLANPKSRIYSYLEQPWYVQINKYLKSSGDYSMSWLSQNRKISIREPIDKDYHSFFVYTKGHKDKCLEIEKKVKQYEKNPANTPVELNQYFIRESAKVMGNEPIALYRVDDFFSITFSF